MTFLAADFESFYDPASGYSLGSMSTEEYVRDGRFRAHGAAVSVDWGADQWITHDELPRFFAQFEWSRVSFLAHHAQFDGLILSHHYGHHPALMLDTMSYARMLALPGSLAGLARHFGLPPKGKDLALSKGLRVLPAWVEPRIAEYSKHDNWLCREIFKRLREMLPARELELTSNVIKMFTRPLMHINPEPLAARIAEIEAKKLQLVEDAGVPLGTLMSNQQLHAYLLRLGVTPPQSLAKTNPELLELLEHPDDRVALAVAARLGVKGTMEQTRAQKLIDMGQRGAACVYLNMGGAGTTRLSGGDGTNFQNFKRGSPLRECLEAPEGHVLCVSDSKQVEARTLDWLADQHDAVEKWRVDFDQYVELAERAFPGQQIDKIKRGFGKVLKLGMGYGMGADRLKDGVAGGLMGNPPMTISQATAEDWKNIYRDSHQMVCRLWKRADSWIEAMAEGRDIDWKMLRIRAGKIILPNDLELRYKNLSMDTDGSWTYSGQHGDFTRIHGPKLVQNIIEGLTRDIVMRQLNAIARELPVLSTTHDEVVALARAEDGEDVCRWMESEMQKLPDWARGCPIGAEAGSAFNYVK